MGGLTTPYANHGAGIFTYQNWVMLLGQMSGCIFQKNMEGMATTGGFALVGETYPPINQHNYRTSPFFMGKPTINGLFNSKLLT